MQRSLSEYKVKKFIVKRGRSPPQSIKSVFSWYFRKASSSVIQINFATFYESVLNFGERISKTSPVVTINVACFTCFEVPNHRLSQYFSVVQRNHFNAFSCDIRWERRNEGKVSWTPVSQPSNQRPTSFTATFHHLCGWGDALSLLKLYIPTFHKFDC
jgi:hypothetical protein